MTNQVPNMSSEPIVPTFILQSDGLFREGLRLILSRTRFRPQGCEVELNDLAEIPSDGPLLFIVGVGHRHDSLCRRIRAQYPSALIVAVGDENSSECLSDALDDGANGALFNSITPSGLVGALHAVVSGVLIVVDARLASLDLRPKSEEPRTASVQNDMHGHNDIHNDAPLHAQNGTDPGKLFSAREVAILARIVRGDSNKHVARLFRIAEPTVKAHVKTIFRKIGASNRTQAAFWALNHRIFDSLDGLPSDVSDLLSPDGNNPVQRRAC
ncbi:response regulator transcription factor [Bradyrhizobium huanghuaihaiense]|uniref:LuxR C-terminal-related transcriptional regulator n=1 Tax=Bradyrhizobium huanghuaihaiense TaxID=990078 RepID=UPI0021AA0708|nr:response regulator transcription factor [Bradyrhizobium sp. CB3035]UWU74829.1 response regulator transcription factor [Bradyrhizobium sp. CB3035]